MNTKTKKNKRELSEAGKELMGEKAKKPSAREYAEGFFHQRKIS